MKKADIEKPPMSPEVDFFLEKSDVPVSSPAPIQSKGKGKKSVISTIELSSSSDEIAEANSPIPIECSDSSDEGPEAKLRSLMQPRLKRSVLLVNLVEKVLTTYAFL